MQVLQVCAEAYCATLIEYLYNLLTVTQQLLPSYWLFVNPLHYHLIGENSSAAKAPGLFLPVKNFSSCVLCFIHFLSSSDYKTLFKTLRRILVLITHCSASQLSPLCDRILAVCGIRQRGQPQNQYYF